MEQINPPLFHQNRNTRLLKITCIFWLIVKLTGWRMWTCYRLFPTAPVLESLDAVPPVIHTVLFLLSVVFILGLLLFKTNRYVLVALSMVEILSCLLDQNRWQPWEYQCLFICFLFIINLNKPKLLTASFAFILTATYLYSGLGKLNGAFLQTIWSPIILRSFLHLSADVSRQHYVYYGGCLAGLFELICGTGLLFPKTKRLAAKALILMHLFILVLLGPLGLNYNIVVWPWNIVMIVYLYFIFVGKQGAINFKYIFHGWNKLVFVAWGILPALHFIGYWDGFLSSSMYSGKAPKMTICIQDTSKCKQLNKFYGKALHATCSGQAYIDLQNWAITETNVIPNPEVRIYKIIQKKLDKRYAAAGLHYSIY